MMKARAPAAARGAGNFMRPGRHMLNPKVSLEPIAIRLHTE